MKVDVDCTPQVLEWVGGARRARTLGIGVSSFGDEMNQLVVSAEGDNTLIRSPRHALFEVRHEVKFLSLRHKVLLGDVLHLDLHCLEETAAVAGGSSMN